jgi:hypothetical protein
MGYILRDLRQIKMMFISTTGKVIYSQAKAHYHISLMYFMQKMMQKFETRNAKDETLENVTYIYKNLPTTQGSPYKPQRTM